jgi:hypothetical protein
VEYLAITDTDAIHSYVFAPHELRLIRGGSGLLDACNYKAEALLSNSARRIFAGGGQVLASFPSEQAAWIYCREVQQLYREKTAVATISPAVFPYPSPGQFQKSLEALQFEMERAKQRRAAGHFNGGSPYFASCESCGMNACSSKSIPPGSKLICNACRLREKKAMTLRHDNPHEPQSFEEIAKERRPQNYLALIYCDFDRLGRFLRENIQGREDRYSALSERVRGMVDHAIQKASAHVLQQAAPGTGVCMPVPLVQGGDDAVLIMAAQDAIAFLWAFKAGIDEFWEMEDQKPERHLGVKRPSFSAGMVLAHSHFPIAEFMRIAEELLKSAKRLTEQDAIDYEVVTNSMVGEVLKPRKSFARRRTAKPYQWEDFQALAESLRSLKQERAPASKIRGLYHIAYQADLQAELEYLHLLSRLESRHREILRKPEAVGLGLWPPGSVGTRAADLAELWEFV